MARLDTEVFARGLSKSRENAKTMIKNGCVFVNGKVISRPSEDVSPEDEITAVSDNDYVGRGAVKLAKAITAFGIDVSGRICIDIGASTGGFTDCMLKNGASKVYAVDVGTGQLAEKLISDPRVINLEKTDIRNTDSGFFNNEKIGFIAVDVSFISLTLILPKVAELLSDDGEVVVLIKPQFEAGRSNLNKNGVVKSKKVHVSVIEDIIAFSEGFFGVLGLTYSPVARKDGNIEYLLHLRKSRVGISPDVEGVVSEAAAKVVFDK